MCSPLLHIFNLSLPGVFPNKWKESYVDPIFKEGSRSDVECYRGVAILPTFGKLFESIVCEILADRFRHFIFLAQHGFMKGRSTTTNLVAVRVVEAGQKVDLVYTDMRKAFDRVRHDVLICKLRELGVHSCMLRWIQSYLTGRLQYVKLLGWKSHLGPLL